MTTMTIIDVCRYVYPGQIEAGNIHFGQGLDGIIHISQWSVPATPEPTTQALEALIPTYQHQFDFDYFDTYESVLLSAYADIVAQEKRYDSAVACATYIHSSVMQWVNEATTFIAWRDAVYSYLIEQEALMVAEERTIPTFDEFKEELPVIVWP